MFLGCTVVSTVTRARSLVRSAPLCVRHPQALGQQQLELVAQPLPPVAEIGALVREGVLEERLAGEVLEVRIVDPALADAFVGQPEHVLEQQQADHEAALDARAGPCRCRAARSRRRSTPSRSWPPSCTSSCFMLMIWSSLARNRSPSPVASCFFGRIVSSDAAIEITARRQRESQSEIARFWGSDRQTLQSKTCCCAENRFAFNRLAVVHGRLLCATRALQSSVPKPCSMRSPSRPARVAPRRLALRGRRRLRLPPWRAPGRGRPGCRRCARCRSTAARSRASRRSAPALPA